MQPVLALLARTGWPVRQTIAVPTDRPRPAVQSFRGRAGAVRASARADGVTPGRRASGSSAPSSCSCSTGFAVTLHRWSGQTDMLIGSVSGGRDRPELERLIGYFLRILVIRADLTGDPSFHELAQPDSARAGRGPVPRRRALPVAGPGPGARARSGPKSLFQVTFSIEPPLPALGAEWDLTEMDAGTTVSKFDLSLELEDRGEVIGGRAIYSCDLFDPETIESLTTEFAAVLARAVDHPDARSRPRPGAVHERDGEPAAIAAGGQGLIPPSVQGAGGPLSARRLGRL